MHPLRPHRIENALVRHGQVLQEAARAASVLQVTANPASSPCTMRGRHYYPPLLPTKEPQAASWCNGNTGDFDSLVQGSNPCEATTLKMRSSLPPSWAAWKRGRNSGLQDDTPMSTPGRDQIKAAFEAARETPGAAYEEDNLVWHLIAKPDGANGIHNSGKGKRHLKRFYRPWSRTTAFVFRRRTRTTCAAWSRSRKGRRIWWPR